MTAKNVNIVLLYVNDCDMTITMRTPLLAYRTIRQKKYFGAIIRIPNEIMFCKLNIFLRVKFCVHVVVDTRILNFAFKLSIKKKSSYDF